MTIVIAVEREIVKEHGANAAIVHQQVQWVIAQDEVFGRSQGHSSGWFTGSSEQLAELTGLSPDQCRRAMSTLIAGERMEKRKFRANQGDQTCSYRPADPTVSASGDSAISGDRDSAESRDGDSAGCTTPEELESNSPPTPPGGLDEPAKLFDDGTPEAGATRRSETKRRASSADPHVEATFDVSFWKHYPTDGGNRGDRKSALRAFAKRLKAGSSSEEIAEHLGHYRDARQRYRDHFGQSTVLLNGSSFLNGKFDMFDHCWSDEELKYWPAPPGMSWDRKRRKSRRELEREMAEAESV